MIDIGHTIGNYKITAKLGEGGMGVVYLAEHPVIGKKVAMKAIHPELSKNSDVVSRFITEAKAVNQIGHEHIVDIADFGNTSDGEFYFVMEYLQGESLSDRLKRVKNLPVRQAMSIGAQIADALNASHQQGIIHRDLKPENIFLCLRGANHDFVKVLDFGLAKLTQNDQKVTHKTRTGSVMGTPYYMSPEQCEGKIEIDYRADIYSLGVLIFEMLTGKVPFGGEGYGEIIVKHVTMPPPSVRSIVPELPEYLDLLLYRVLAKDRDQRFQTMADLRDALLDPERYASSAPEVGIPEDLSGIARAAAPMARAELEERSQMGYASGIGAKTPPATGTPSGRGELINNIDTLIRTKPGSRLVLFFGIASLTVAAIVLLGPRRDTRRPLPVASLPLHPATVRVNFNSDPDGAVVTRADGQTLGLTPLSIEVAYSDSAVEFWFKKAGYEPKPMYVVPNLPLPMFAQLRRVSVEPVLGQEAAAGGDTADKSAPGTTGHPRRHPPGTIAAKAEKIERVERTEKPDKPSDPDGVLEPSIK
jgi:eukaryotic-like serine/threonine-protein kinase